jgi:hypothetical protein
MPKFTITGSEVHSSIQVAIAELEFEAENLVGRAIVEQKKLESYGMKPSDAQAQIIRAVKSSDDFVGVWENHVDKIVNEMSKQLVAKPAITLGQKNPDQLFKWVLGSVKTSHCPDCLFLTKEEPRTLKGWQALNYGLPREGGTVCNVGCKCMLSPVDPPIIAKPKSPTDSYNNFDKAEDKATAYFQQKATPLQRQALKDYTSNGYTTVNQILRGKYDGDTGKYPIDADRVRKAERTIEHLQRGLENAPKYTGISFRGITSQDYDKILKQYEQGNLVHELGFTSSSSSQRVAIDWTKHEDIKVQVQIKGRSGVAIGSEVSSAGGEAEVLYPFGTTFKVAKVTKDLRTESVNKGGRLLDQFEDTRVGDVLILLVEVGFE